MNLHELIDEAIEQPTPLRIDDHLRSGRRTLRRRRASLALGGGAAVAVMALAVIVVPGGDDAPPAPVPAASSDQERPEVPSLVTPIGPAGYRLDGTLRIEPGWEVVERLEQPFTDPVSVNGDVRRVPERSVALELTDGTETQWVLTWWSELSTKTTNIQAQPADIGPASLTAWVDIEVALATGGATTAVASVTADDAMAGRNGVEILTQRRTPGLDRPGTSTAVARVTFPGEFRSDGWILLVRTGEDVRTYPVRGYPVVNDPANNGPDTVAGFVEWVTPEVEAGRYP